ncbi:hypothetical protein, variant [Blastomyces gilchristii SLH14081]|uniref:Uncharacterized protein n=1 Tax=Blastomyces gilchristii (strain SLH14081) TaxID=559298 RepID=A0A179V1N6_BLAGS|nr:hypothetical protein, variant [Blastomyces gilchristii SLH14081]OAT13241.1 hypothetical protein, variant [Blastomyces gilchristii SLH14081]
MEEGTEAFAVNPGYNNGVFPQNMSMQGPYYAGYIAPGQGARWSPPGLEAWPREGPPSGTPNAVVGWPATTNDSYVAVVRGDHLGNTGTVRRRWHSTIKKGKGMPCASVWFLPASVSQLSPSKKSTNTHIRPCPLATLCSPRLMFESGI